MPAEYQSFVLKCYPHDVAGKRKSRDRVVATQSVSSNVPEDWANYLEIFRNSHCTYTTREQDY